MKTIPYVFFFLVIVLTSCKEKSNPAAAQQDHSSLIQRWTNSYEEQIDSVQVYRPSSSQQFPASRFREVFAFAEDSSCAYLVLAPNDAHYMQTGTWSITSYDKKVITIFDSNKAIYKTFQIVELMQNLLRFVYIN